MLIYYILAAIAGAAIGVGVYMLVSRKLSAGKADAIIEKAKNDAENIKQQKILQAKEKFLQLKSEHEKFVNDKNSQIRDTENRLNVKTTSSPVRASSISRPVS